MKILLTGGSGFVGSYVLRELVDSGHSVHALVRRGSSDELVVAGENLTPVRGDILDRPSLDGAMKDCDAVIHLVGIIREFPSRGITFERIHAEGTRNVVDAAIRAGVKRFVHLSANGARADGVSAYQTTKWEAERAVESAGFDCWTIFRPSIVFGKPDPGRPEFASDLVRQLVRPFPILPVFGDGRYQLQPVAVTSLARGLAKAVDGSFHESVFEVAGPEALAYADILDLLAVATGSKAKPQINVPVGMVSMGIAALGWTGLLPITADQLAMLVAGNTCDFEHFHHSFGLDPIPFDVEHLSYVSAA